MFRTELYNKIKTYSDVIPGYPLAFSFFKKKECYYWMLRPFCDDVLQTLALSCLESDGSYRQITRIAAKNLYRLKKAVEYERKVAVAAPGKKYHSKPKYPFVCGRCKVEKKEYPRKSVLPGMVVCASCSRAVWREDNVRNGLNARGSRKKTQ